MTPLPRTAPYLRAQLQQDIDDGRMDFTEWVATVPRHPLAEAFDRLREAFLELGRALRRIGEEWARRAVYWVTHRASRPCPPEWPEAKAEAVRRTRLPWEQPRRPLKTYLGVRSPSWKYGPGTHQAARRYWHRGAR